MFSKKKTMAELVKTTQAKEDLESQLKSANEKIASLEKDLSAAKGKIGELEDKLENTDLKELEEKARQSAAQFEGLKKLYIGKIREFDHSKEIREEEFEKDASLKRYNLEEEIRTNREENQEMVSNTVKDFAGSYLYYMDQIRTMMEALSQAAAETGKTLFSGERANVKERFGASVAEHLRNDVSALEQGTGDRMLIGTMDEVKEEASDEAIPEETEAEEEAAEEEPLTAEAPDSFVDEEEEEAEDDD